MGRALNVTLRQLRVFIEVAKLQSCFAGSATKSA